MMKRKSFTLIETIIAVGLSSLIIVAVSSMFFVGDMSWVSTSSRMILEERLNTVLKQINNDVTYASIFFINVPSSHDAINTIRFPLDTDFANMVDLDADRDVVYGVDGHDNWYVNYIVSSGNLIRQVFDNTNNLQEEKTLFSGVTDFTAQRQGSLITVSLKASLPHRRGNTDVEVVRVIHVDN